MRPSLKRGLEALLARAGTNGSARRWHRGRVLVLAYHNIVPVGQDTAGERTLHLSQQAFAEQLELLAAGFDVIPLSDLSKPRRPDARAAVAITFDDAYHGTVTAGVTELARRGLPATIFVPPGYLGGRAFWWDLLAAEGGVLDRALRESLLNDRLGDGDIIGAWATAEHRERRNGLPAHALGATEAELVAAVAIPGITLGAHSWSHPNLTRVDDARLHTELARPLDWLRRRFPGAVVPWLSYPYGLEDTRVRCAAAQAGYDGAVRISGGWHRPGAVDPYAVPRITVAANTSRNGFSARAAGLLR